MLNNLKREMIEHNVTSGDIAEKLYISEESVNKKIEGLADFTVSEAIIIKINFFPHRSHDYLFESSDSIDQHK